MILTGKGSERKKMGTGLNPSNLIKDYFSKIFVCQLLFFLIGVTEYYTIILKVVNMANKIQTPKLGSCGLEVSAIVLGCMGWNFSDGPAPDKKAEYCIVI
jgi:hypothetical protein